MRKRLKTAHETLPEKADDLAACRQRCSQLAKCVQALHANLRKLQSHYDKQQLRLAELESGLVTAREAELLAEIARLHATNGGGSKH
jgi:hypothetical protein